MDNSRKAIGERLKKQRKYANMTQEQLAEKLDISIKHYSEAERGIIGFSLDNWIKVSEILGTSLDYLLLGISVDYPIPLKLIELYRTCPDNKKETLLKLIELEIELLK